MRQLALVHGRPASELHSSNWRMGRHIAESGVKVFQIETTLNTDTFPSQFAFLQKREWEWGAAGPGHLRRHRRRRSTPPRPGWPGRSSTRSGRPTR